MDKKKLKLSISGNSKKTINNIEQAKSNPKNSVIIRSSKGFQKKKYNKSSSSQNFNRSNPTQNFRRTEQAFFQKKDISDFEKRKIAEQRATKRLKGDVVKENKEKSNVKKRELKLTVSRALSNDDGIEIRC